MRRHRALHFHLTLKLQGTHTVLSLFTWQWSCGAHTPSSPSSHDNGAAGHTHCAVPPHLRLKLLEVHTACTPHQTLTMKLRGAHIVLSLIWCSPDTEAAGRTPCALPLWHWSCWAHTQCSPSLDIHLMRCAHTLARTRTGECRKWKRNLEQT